MGDALVLNQIIEILSDCLGLGDRGRELTTDTQLINSIPEFDSMAVVTVITMIEEQFGIFVEDDDISAETFETVGSLCEFVERKISES